MQTKLFEVRDDGTFIPVIAIKVTGSDHPLLREAGFGLEQDYVLLGRLNKGQFTYNPFDWTGGSRTMQVAHIHMKDNWESLVSGQVIDVAFIEGETPTPKRPQREEMRNY